MISPTSAGANYLRSLRHPILFTLSAASGPALWLLFVDTLGVHELLLGSAASVATIVFLAFVCRSSAVELTLLPHDLAQCGRIPWYIAIDVCVVTGVLAKDLLNIEKAQSLFRVCRFDTNTEEGVRKARTVMATAYTTASPNMIVIGVDRSQSRMLFHQIESSKVPETIKALGATFVRSRS